MEKENYDYERLIDIEMYSKDIKESFIEGTEESEFWYLINSYLKILYPSLKEELDNKIRNVIKSSEKFSKYFNKIDNNKAIEEYLKLIDNNVIIKHESYDTIIKKLATSVISNTIEKGEISKNSGINNLRTLYNGDIELFNETDKSLTENFLKIIEQNAGKSGVEKALQYAQKQAEIVIEDKSKYYEDVVKYLVGFYANVGLAKIQEMEEQGIVESE